MIMTMSSTITAIKDVFSCDVFHSDVSSDLKCVVSKLMLKGWKLFEGGVACRKGAHYQGKASICRRPADHLARPNLPSFHSSSECDLPKTNPNCPSVVKILIHFKERRYLLRKGLYDDDDNLMEVLISSLWFTMVDICGRSQCKLLVV